MYSDLPAETMIESVPGVMKKQKMSEARRWNLMMEKILGSVLKLDR